MVTRGADGLAISTASIQRGDRVVTGDGVDIGRVRKVYGGDALDGHILVVGRDQWSGSVVAYAIPLWAPQRRDAAAGLLHISAHHAYVHARWRRASSAIQDGRAEATAVPADRTREGAVTGAIRILPV